MQTVTSMIKWDLLPLSSSAKAESQEKHRFLGEAFYFSLPFPRKPLEDGSV